MSADTRKALTLIHQEQREAYQNAKQALESERGEELPSGEVVKELAKAYTGWPAESADSDRI